MALSLVGDCPTELSQRYARVSPPFRHAGCLPGVEKAGLSDGIDATGVKVISILSDLNIPLIQYKENYEIL